MCYREYCCITLIFLLFLIFTGFSVLYVCTRFLFQFLLVLLSFKYDVDCSVISFLFLFLFLLEFGINESSYSADITIFITFLQMSEAINRELNSIVVAVDQVGRTMDLLHNTFSKGIYSIQTITLCTQEEFQLQAEENEIELKKSREEFETFPEVQLIVNPRQLKK